MSVRSEPPDRSRETPQGLRMLLGAFRDGDPLERIVAKPLTESGRHAVSHKKAGPPLNRIE